MSFDFSNINPINKAQASYKDGSGMGGGGMYFRQGKNVKMSRRRICSNAARTKTRTILILSRN